MAIVRFGNGFLGELSEVPPTKQKITGLHQNCTFKAVTDSTIWDQISSHRTLKINFCCLRHPIGGLLWLLLKTNAHTKTFNSMNSWTLKKITLNERSLYIIWLLVCKCLEEANPWRTETGLVLARAWVVMGWEWLPNGYELSHFGIKQ